MENSKPETFRSAFLSLMSERGFIHQCTDFAALDSLLSDGQVTGYVGFDATAESLHVGHLVSLMSLRHLAACGHRAIALMGGATTMVGDPSFRNSARPMLSEAGVAANLQGIRSNVSSVMSGHEGSLTFVNNADWLCGIGMIDFMRSVGTQFTVARMLSMESVSARLDAGQPMTMMEFSYMMLQAADFLELSRRHGCVLQMGGSDQWGNIVNGIELARRTDGASLFGLTTPLLATASGEKMGKSANGAVWLSADRLPPADFWQFWRNVDDADVGRFLALFTELPMDTVRSLSPGSGQALNEAKRILANEVTAIVHGRAAAREAEARAAGLFGDSPAGVSHTVEAPGGTVGLLDLMLEVGLAQTKGEARRLIRGSGVRLDGTTVADEKLSIPVGPEPVLISVGKKRRALVAFR